MVPATTTRVQNNTDEKVNARIRKLTETNVAYYASGGRAAIDRRLEELDREWDIERFLETMAPSFTLLGMSLGLFASKKWFILPIAVQSFLLQHSLQGWCPPVPVLRRMGVRTSEEIDEERNALKALRGDYREVGNGRNGGDVRRAIDAAKRRRAPNGRAQLRAGALQGTARQPSDKRARRRSTIHENQGV